jgi:hypothetical protein
VKKKYIRWSANLSYIIGLIASDGCLSKDGRHIDFTSKDLDQVETFARLLKLSNKISIKHNGHSLRDYYRIQFGNVALYRFLLNIGLTTAKSKTIGKLKIPDKYFADFLRGSMDGDGFSYSYFDPRWKNSFQLYTGFVSASRVHVEWLSSKIERQYNIKGIIKINKRAFTLEFAKKNSILLINLIYHKRQIPYLARKYSKIIHSLDIISGVNLGNYADVAKWYTRHLEVVVPERVWRFNSSRPHKN